MNPVRNSIIGVAIGDMLGVPVEGASAEMLAKDPVVALRKQGADNQRVGVWSDDTSLTLCLADSLTRGYSLEDMAQTFLRWKIAGEWSAHGPAFGIGRQTHDALNDLYRILESGDTDSLELLHLEASEKTNGNGSLMRIAPLYFYLQHEHMEDRFDNVWQVSALTHPHVRAALACLMYLIMLDELATADSVQVAYLKTALRMREFLDTHHSEERPHFARLIDQDLRAFARSELRSGGYVIETLEASFWCLLTTSSYRDAVLTAVNLGYDTDTTAAVTGGMAGFFYGIDTAPIEWYEAVARIEDIEKLSDALYHTYPHRPRERSPLVQFIAGEGLDSNGRTHADVLAMDDEALEQEHDYIQWLFPLREQSGAVWDAPTLTNDDIADIAHGDESRQAMQRALERMRRFYGENDHWLVPHEHNHLRITRVLKSTRILLGKEHAHEFYRFITKRIEGKGVHTREENVAYWNAAIGLSAKESLNHHTP
ncbi:MAG: ADP-ribosylglycohydrolase family protein [Candidatus Pacebacteria bacterium]|nr:ADP-ribosylglycohydrolase family protein [Candidatus Paceibacterota bacterium]